MRVAARAHPSPYAVCFHALLGSLLVSSCSRSTVAFLEVARAVCRIGQEVVEEQDRTIPSYKLRLRILDMVMRLPLTLREIMALVSKLV